MSKKKEVHLTPREKQIIQLAGKGKLSKEIAVLVSLSVNTVNKHKQNVYDKYEVKNLAELRDRYPDLFL